MILKNLGRTVLTLATLSLVGCGEEQTRGEVASEAPASPRGTEAVISTLRDGNAYRVYVDGVERAYVPLREPSNTIVTAVARDGSKAAIIPEHDTSQGESLQILDVASGTLRTLVRGPVTSAAFSLDGKHLAYVVETAGGASVKLGTTTSAGRTVGEIQGRQVDLLGFSSDGLSLFAVVYPDRQDEGTFAPSLVRMNIADGQSTAILAGAPLVSELRYNDIRLVRINGQDMVSYIRSGHQLCVGTSELQLATTEGRVVQSFRPTTDVYRAAAWSPDASQVAFSVQQCPDKAAIVADREAASAAQAQGTGVFVAEVASGQATRVVEGIPTVNLLGIDSGVLRFGTDREGVESLDIKPIRAGTQAAVKAASLLPSKSAGSGEVSAMGRTNVARHVNQVYDTRDTFDGRGSCGPTSAVMTMAGYQLAEWGMYVNYGGYHYSGWGRYVTDAYSYNGTSFNRTQPDYSGRGAFAGAHGWVYLPCCGAGWANMKDYMNRHTGWTIQAGWDANWVRNELNRGQLIAVSGKMTSAGHIILIKGWTDDGRWVVNDPFGVNTSGGPGGADQIYSTTYIGPAQVWSN